MARRVPRIGQRADVPAQESGSLRTPGAGGAVKVDWERDWGRLARTHGTEDATVTADDGEGE
jgi:hypothetical protein